MAHPYWPIFDIRLSLGEVRLRPVTEADLVPLADIRPADFESDPRLPSFRPTSLDVAVGEAGSRVSAGISLHQSYWSSLGSWRPESWRLGFAVEVDGHLAGVQELEASEFAVRRTVESASWLALRWRGQGVGKAMRLAVLALAFDALGAQAAETEAWHDNAASLGVSRSLGYVDNGVTLHPRGDHAEDMPRLRMTRAVWLSRHAGHGVRITGVDACRHFFGIP